MEGTSGSSDDTQQTPGTPSTPKRTSTNVYSRLYDPKSYTGVYRKRFENDCHDLTESVVHDLSNAMRTNLNYDSIGHRSTRNISSNGSTPNAPAAPPVPVSVPAERPASTSVPPAQEKLQGDPNDPHTLLKAVFHYYCRFGRTGPKGVGEKTLDNSNFVKLCRDCPDLLDSSFGKTDVDLIFVKSKKKGERRINYARFLDALGMIAIQKYGDMPLEGSVPKLLEAHLAHLPCLLEFTDGKTVQAVWQKRSEQIDGKTTAIMNSWNMRLLSSSETFGDLRLLPVDYHQQVARELASFFHGFYRFGAASNRFDLNDELYTQFLHNVLFGSLCIGAVVFFMLCVIVVRRCILHIRSAFVRRMEMDSTSVELMAVMLLTFLAVSALGGLLGEAQVDYSAGIVLDTMGNTSTRFQEAQALTVQSLKTSDALRFTADNLVTSFNESELPAEAYQLSVESLRLLHASKELWNQTDTLLPKNYSDIAKEWEFSYFALKSSTNGAILAVALASFLSIASVGWALVAPLRVSILVILSVVPISHTLIGVYLASTIMTADFCAAPMNSTLELLGSTPIMNYYVECPANASLPFHDYTTSVQQSVHKVATLQKELEDYASHHGDVGLRMKEFLNPIGTQLNSISSQLTEFADLQTCQNVSSAFAYATTTYCEYGMLGFFSMWVHQIMLCFILFVSIVVCVLVYERVHIRELRLDVRYQLVSSYEEDDMEHAYLSSD
ncbi:hypothetical protein BBO99_00007659 [Phytophthora kernoviae]|uniref:Uncharacterized protein n=1 Tax=Phytophthora kernoviae TaxID=325452 RepID=A0A3R7MMJ2_9STRA|nr:hypothetical protein JM16_008149 [Phytophthora kernoviae]KAG2515751.1 hypothetical protein JM18_008116 [Phytophthora kernoviae]RLN10741.1 hypothetical protein BBI17_007181 [Phytophthora kernoviae]RLN76306.1 hypothetical protein BBO99_00007659 [Phytophthora kernoviae]